MDTASSQPEALVLPMRSAQRASDVGVMGLPGIAATVIDELGRTAEAETCGLTCDEFASALAAIGAKHNYGQPPGTLPDPPQRVAFLRSLRLADLALASGCALGRDAAWQRFLKLYRGPLTQAAIAIAGSATLGHDLADSLYAELYGLRGSEGERRSPLASYSGRGSLLGWLRTTLAQRHTDHHRRTHREAPLDSVKLAAPVAEAMPVPAELAHLTQAVARTLKALTAEDRFLLSAYYLDRQTLLEIGRTLRVHESTISRQLKRLVADLRKKLLHHLQSGGLNKRAAEEALGIDPRDIEINLSALLQTSQTRSFQDKAGPTAVQDPS